VKFETLMISSCIPIVYYQITDATLILRANIRNKILKGTHI
jgi:hypothetical protein